MPTKRLHTKLAPEFVEVLSLVEQRLKKFERIHRRYATKAESRAIILEARKEVFRKWSKN